MQSPPALNVASPLVRPVASSTTSSASVAKVPNKAMPSASVNFDDLWNMSLGSKASSSLAPSAPGAATATKSIKDLEREKAQANMWGAGMPGASGLRNEGPGGLGMQSSAPAGANGADDLLL